MEHRELEEKRGPTPRISVILGPPGTGKTTTLSRWAARAASHYGHDRVLICSLTRTAARQAAREIELPSQQIGTAHAFAYRALGSPIIAEGKVAEWNTAYPELPLSGHNATADDAYTPHESTTTADAAKQEVARLRTAGLDPLHATNPLTVFFYERWEDWKRQCGYMDYADLIATALVDVEKAPGEPAVMMVDEAQDIGLLETRLLFKWAAHTQHIVLSGDSQQALFSFRGSDPLLLQRLWLENDASRAPLQQSFRLSQAVYDSVYTWAGRFTKTMRLAFTPRNIPGSVQCVPWSFGHITSSEVERLVTTYIDGSESEYVPLMFLATCGYMLEPIILALREAGIPFYNPWRAQAGNWNPLPQKRVKGHTIVDRVLAFLRTSTDTWGEQARFWTVPELKSWAGGLPATGVFTRGGNKAIQALAETATDEEIARTFAQWFVPEALAHILPHADLHWYLSQVKGSDRLRDFVTTIAARYGPAMLKERPRVVVGTVHSTKGAEATTVIIAPDVSVQAWEGARQDESVAEELRRVFYVGLSRSRQNLLLCEPSSRFAVRW